MADDDEIDILGDFSFNSCLAQNNQGIPSCSSREDTVHPQWLLDSTATNWYDSEREKRLKLGPARKLSGNSAMNKHNRVRHSSWNQAERDILGKEMAKYGRNVHKISQTLKTKTVAEIQALIEAEHGINLDTPSFGLVKNDEQEDVPNVVQEEIVTDESSINNVLSLVATGSPTIAVPNKHPFRKKNNNKSLKSFSYTNNAHLKPDLLTNSPEIFYDDDLIIGSTESIGSDSDPMDIMTQHNVKQHREKIKAVKKIGNHRRKVSRNFDRGRPRTSSKELLKSPQEGRKKDSSLSEDNTKSPKLQIVLGSGQALPISEGEQVIKIEKKKDSESDSDIEVDIDSDHEGDNKREVTKEEPQCSSSHANEAPIAVPLTNFEPMRKRQRKINLLGGGGCTIMHTAAGDLVRVEREPRRARAPRRRPVELLPCPYYGLDPPAPYTVVLGVSALVLMDAHAHTSRAEVMGLLGGQVRPAPAPALHLAAYRPARAAAGATHCDMDPVSQAEAGAWLRARGLRVLGWHHSHPAFPALPSAQDAASQRALQPLDPFLALVTSQRCAPAAPASSYRCFRVEEDGSPLGAPRALRVRLSRDVRAAPLLRALTRLLRRAPSMATDVCPFANRTYLEKCVLSVRHHLLAAGYAADDPEVLELLAGLRDVFRSPPEAPASPDHDWAEDSELDVFE